eukprot:1653544-Prymnesium_polylepis.1
MILRLAATSVGWDSIPADVPCISWLQSVSQAHRMTKKGHALKNWPILADHASAVQVVGREARDCIVLVADAANE